MAFCDLALAGLTGGGAGALDALTGYNDGDAAMVVLSTGAYWYHYDASSTDSENSPLRIIPDDNSSGTGAWHLVGTTARIGALVELSSDQSITTSGSPQDVNWEAEVYDDAEFWEGVTNPSRITIPIGVTSIKIRSNIQFAFHATGYRRVLIVKNNASMKGKPDVLIDASVNSINTIINLSSPELAVSATDYFEVRVIQTSGGALNVDASDSTWFSIEAVGFA